MRGIFGGMVSGGLVSVLALSTASVLSEPPAGSTPPLPPLVDAPGVQAPRVETPSATASTETSAEEGTGDQEAASAEAEGPGVSSPVGAVTITAPIAPDLPAGATPAEVPAQASGQAPVTPRAQAGTPAVPNADTASPARQMLWALKVP